jgi:hypothetical protein
MNAGAGALWCHKATMRRLTDALDYLGREPAQSATAVA